MLAVHIDPTWICPPVCFSLNETSGEQGWRWLRRDQSEHLSMAGCCLCARVCVAGAKAGGIHQSQSSREVLSGVPEMRAMLARLTSNFA